MDSESAEMFIRLNEQKHTRGIWGSASVTTCQKEPRLGMMAAMILHIKSWLMIWSNHFHYTLNALTVRISIFPAAHTERTAPQKTENV